MITSKVAVNQAFSEISRVSKSPGDRDNARSHPNTDDGSVNEAVSGDTRTELSAFSTNRLHQFNAEFTSVLKSVRIADQAMEQMQANVEQMQSEVQTFVKMYPPYPPGSEERIEMLKRYSGLRLEIEQLTLPKDLLAGDILTDVRHADIPALSMDATDEEIIAAHEALTEVGPQIGKERSLLAMETEQLIQNVG